MTLIKHQIDSDHCATLSSSNVAKSWMKKRISAISNELYSFKLYEQGDWQSDEFQR